MDSITKKCSKCGIEKPISNFWKNKNLLDGHRYECNQCTKSINKKWRSENNDKRNESERERYKSKAEQIREYMRSWYSKNIESQREKSRLDYASNKDREKKRFSIWKSNNKDKVNVYSVTRRTRMVGNGGTYTNKEWKELCDKYGNKCLACGRSDVKLTVDHVIPVKLGGTSSIDNLQPLCRPCNSSKNARHIDYRK